MELIRKVGSPNLFGDFLLRKTEVKNGKISNSLNGIKLNEKDKEALGIMGLELNANWTEIQKKFKTLVKKFHPDKNAGSKKFEDKLKKITLAYSHLKVIMIKK